MDISKELKDFLKTFPYKKILLGIVIIWLSVAINYIPFNDGEARFLQHSAFARCLVVFLFAFLTVDLDSKYHIIKRSIYTSIITALYYLTVEI